jgi:hypothetical protein
LDWIDPRGASRKHENGDQSEPRIFEQLPDGEAESVHGISGF